MKKIALLIAIIIASGSVAAVFFLSQNVGEGNDAVNRKFGSLQGTEVDQESSRKVIDYFLATMGEQPLSDIKNQSTQFQPLDPNLKIKDVEFDKFIEYKLALNELAPIDYEVLDLNALQDLHSKVLDVQAEYFDEIERDNYFAEENLIREMALEKLRLQQQATSASDFNHQWQQYLASKPDYIQRSDKNASLVEKLNDLNNLSGQEKHLARADLVGEEAANRLADLDNQREEFDSRMKSYLSQRDAINQTTSSSEEKAQSIASLRNQSFSESEFRRVEALERIHDAN
ncbi:lipase secretion chaperone [Vibrio nigripulchritudo]|uniref:lipase secretion chaperone n=1 Tax=Vibrio nigripulchritudo TaxID=28173 RepID=UPI0003B1BD6C|nr:lipase secretion chaperone [Vibrio nigripulchritudo]CCN69413.1 putative Proteobacterial lipase chaperone [Vibrio nigripulchritudo SFn118]